MTVKGQDSSEHQSSDSLAQPLLSQALPTLPPELLSLIFKHFVPCRPSEESFEGSPTRLCLVCRQWRTIAIGDPTLWCSLGLTKFQLRNLEYLEGWLERSQGRALSIGIWAQGPNAIIISGFFEALHVLTQTHGTSGRLIYDIEHLAIKLPPLNFDPEDIQGRRANSFLKKIEFVPSNVGRHVFIVGGDLGDNSDFLLDFLSFSSCNRLSQITVGSSIHIYGCIEILRNLPSLRSCTFHLWSFGFGLLQIPTSHLSLPNLEELVITSNYFPLEIVLKITTPRLRSLTINLKGAFRNAPLNRTGLVDFFTRSGNSVRELVFEATPLTKAEYESIMKILDLESIKVCERRPHNEMEADNWGDIHPILAVLSRELEDGSYGLPNLHSLVLVGDMRAPDGVLAQIAENRFNRNREGRGRALEKLQVKFVEHHHREDQRRLRALSSRAKGVGKVLNINLSVSLCGE